MQGYNVGYYIKRIRQEKGISQEALYAGLCSRSTIHRIESGKQQPTMFTAIHLLQRLGLDENSFLVPLGPQDFEICNLKKEIVALNAQFQFEQATGWKSWSLPRRSWRSSFCCARGRWQDTGRTANASPMITRPSARCCWTRSRSPIRILIWRRSSAAC